MHFNTTEYFLFILYSTYIVYGQSSTYGPFRTVAIQLQICDPGSKPQSPHVVTMFTNSSNEKGNMLVNCNLTVTKDIGPLMGRIRMYKWTKDKFMPSLNYVQENVCRFFFPLTVLPVTIKVDAKCNLKKANYTINDIDFEGMCHKFVGDKFFYGKYKYHFEWFTKKSRILCVEAITQIVPFHDA